MAVNADSRAPRKVKLSSTSIPGIGWLGDFIDPKPRRILSQFCDDAAIRAASAANLARGRARRRARPRAPGRFRCAAPHRPRLRHEWINFRASRRRSGVGISVSRPADHPRPRTPDGRMTDLEAAPVDLADTESTRNGISSLTISSTATPGGEATGSKRIFGAPTVRSAKMPRTARQCRQARRRCSVQGPPVRPSRQLDDKVVRELGPALGQHAAAASSNAMRHGRHCCGEAAGFMFPHLVRIIDITPYQVPLPRRSLFCGPDKLRLPPKERRNGTSSSQSAPPDGDFWRPKRNPAQRHR